MAFGNGPRIVTNGLILSLDAGDRNSYPGSGTTWFDLTGNSNSGSLVNGPTFNTGSGGSIVFDGVDDNVTFSSIPGTSFSLISSSFTTEFWIYTTTGSSQGFISSNQSPTNGGQYAFVIRSNGIFSSFYGTVTYTDVYGGDVVTGSWSHYVNTFNYTNQTSSIYVNGVLKGAGSMQSSPLNTSASLIIGRYAFGGGYLKGNIASAKVYNRALPSQEVLQNYNAQKSRFGL